MNLGVRAKESCQVLNKIRRPPAWGGQGPYKDFTATAADDMMNYICNKTYSSLAFYKRWTKLILVSYILKSKIFR
jgi:hypothetical protein